jgi:hypothetical protein
MNRALAGLLGLSMGFAFATGAAPALAQVTSPPTTVVDVSDYDLEPGRNRDGREVAQGDDGDTISYTIVENPVSNGDATTAVTPEAPAAPDLSRVPVMGGADETTVAPPSGEPVSAPVAEAAPAGAAGDATTAAPTGEGAPAVAVCTDFPTWYDAQVFYESMGAAAAQPELVNSLDPNVDGFACEEMVEY